MPALDLDPCLLAIVATYYHSLTFFSTRHFANSAPACTMRFTRSLIAAFAAGSSLVLAGLEDVKSGRHLTASTLDSAISGKNALVAFYAHW